MQRLPHGHRQFIAVVFGLVLLVVAGWLLQRHAHSYTADDIARAKATVRHINQEFAKLSALPNSTAPSTELANDKALQSTYRTVNAQFDTLRTSPVQRNATVHASFVSLDSAWHAKYVYMQDYIGLFLVLDAYDASPAASPVTSNSSALRTYQQQLKEAQTARNQLQQTHPNAAHIAKVRADFMTYLTTSIPLYQTAVRSLQHVPSSADASTYYLSVEAATNPKLKSAGDTFDQALLTDMQPVNQDLSAHSIASKVQAFNTTLAHVQPHS